MTQKETFCKGKFFSTSPQLLQELADNLRNIYGERCTASCVLPAKEGDYYIYLTIFGGTRP